MIKYFVSLIALLALAFYLFSCSTRYLSVLPALQKSYEIPLERGGGGWENEEKSPQEVEEFIFEEPLPTVVG